MIVPFKDFGCAIVNDSGSKSFLIVEYDRHIMDVFIVDVKGLEKKKKDIQEILYVLFIKNWENNPNINPGHNHKSLTVIQELRISTF